MRIEIIASESYSQICHGPSSSRVGNLASDFWNSHVKKKTRGDRKSLQLAAIRVQFTRSMAIRAASSSDLEVRRNLKSIPELLVKHTTKADSFERHV